MNIKYRCSFIAIFVILTIAKSFAVQDNCHDLFAKIFEQNKTKLNDNKNHLDIKNNIWKNILKTNNFSNFNFNNYKDALSYYNENIGSTNSLKIPKSTEEKMAFLESVTYHPKEMNGHSIIDQTETLSELKLLKLKKLLKALHLNSKLTRNEINRFSQELYFTLKGAPVSFLDYFEGNRVTPDDRFLRILQEEFLSYGLKKISNKIAEKENYSSFENLKYFIQNMLSEKNFPDFIKKFNFLWKRQVNLPNELLESILINGFDKHKLEITQLLSEQNKLDHLERIKSALQSISTAIGIAYLAYEFNNNYNNREQNNKKSEEEKFNDYGILTSKVMATIGLSPKGKMRKTSTDHEVEQLERLVEGFREEYGRDPTAQDIGNLRKKIQILNTSGSK